MGEGNQAAFVCFCFTMLCGQAAFLRLGTLFLTAQGEGVLHVLRHRLGRGWVAHPVVMVNLCCQLAALMFNCLLCSRAAYGIAAELTANEMANTGRYAYLHHPDTGIYDNPFDAGLLANAVRFFSSGGAGRDGRAYVDWDALAEARRAGRAPSPPLLSMAVAFRVWARLAACLGRPKRRGGGGGGGGGGGAAHSHSHSHGANGGECSHDHGAAAGAAEPYVRTANGLVPLSQLPEGLQASLRAQLAQHMQAQLRAGAAQV